MDFVFCDGHNIFCNLLLPLTVHPWLEFDLLRIFVTVMFFTSWGRQPHVKPPSWRTRVSLLVWVITCDLSGMGGPTSSCVIASIPLGVI